MTEVTSGRAKVTYQRSDNALSIRVDIHGIELLSWPAAPPELYGTVVRAIVFTDVVGSTDIASRRGDLELIRMLDRHDRLVTQCVSAWQGEVVKTTGDGAMLAFDRASFATVCSHQIQRQATRSGVPLSIGIDFGPIAAHRETEYCGIVANVASRLADLAGENEILLTERAARAARLAGPTFAQAIRGVSDRTRLRKLSVAST